jgi:hypothetical protein
MSNLIIKTDGDPFPALAGKSLESDNLEGISIGDPINNGRTRGFTDTATGFSSIQDQVPQKEYSINYRAGDRDVYVDPVGQYVKNNTPVGVAVNGAVIYCPNSKFKRISVNDSVETRNSGNFTFDVGNQAENSLLDICGGKPEDSGEYRYRNGRFCYKGFNDPNSANPNTRFIDSSTYFSSSSFGSDVLRHPSIDHEGTTFTAGHSKIIGWSLDGYPIYGPFGYQNPLDPTSSVVLMRSTYVVKSAEDLANMPNRPLGDAGGTYIEDYTISFNVPNSLDEFNGRYCITPDYREGTYAYFLTFSDESTDESPATAPKNAAYPYVIGPRTKQPTSY